MPIGTFWQYIRLWLKAAFAPAWDLLGWLSLALGAIFWIWHRFWPASFTRIAAYFGLTPEAAMSDLVWGFPLGLGFLVLGYRLLRAPFEIHLATQAAHDADRKRLDSQIEDLTRRVDKAESNVFVALDTQRLIDRLTTAINDGVIHMGMAKKGQQFPVVLANYTRWDKETAHFVNNQIGSEEWLRFCNANAPVTSNRVTRPFLNDNVALAGYLKGQLECLQELRRTLQQRVRAL